MTCGEIRVKAEGTEAKRGCVWTSSAVSGGLDSVQKLAGRSGFSILVLFHSSENQLATLAVFQIKAFPGMLTTILLLFLAEVPQCT